MTEYTTRHLVPSMSRATLPAGAGIVVRDRSLDGDVRIGPRRDRDAQRAHRCANAALISASAHAPWNVLRLTPAKIASG